MWQWHCGCYKLPQLCLKFICEDCCPEDAIVLSLTDRSEIPVGETNVCLLFFFVWLFFLIKLLIRFLTDMEVWFRNRNYNHSQPEKRTAKLIKKNIEWNIKWGSKRRWNNRQIMGKDWQSGKKMISLPLGCCFPPTPSAAGVMVRVLIKFCERP